MGLSLVATLSDVSRDALRACLLASLLAVAGCGGAGSPSAASISSNLSGTWKGTVQNGAVIDSSTATFSQAGTTLNGTWSIFHILSPATTDSGFLSGSVIGYTVTLTLTPTQPSACPYKVNATLAGSTFMSGTWTTTNCTANASGLMSLTKQ